MTRSGWQPRSYQATHMEVCEIKDVIKAAIKNAYGRRVHSGRV